MAKWTLQSLLPKGKTPAGGTASSDTYRLGQESQVLTVPAYRDHLQDIFTSRQSNDSRTLIKDLFKTDSDLSATVHAYLTIANTEPVYRVRNDKGVLDPKGYQLLQFTMDRMFSRWDYTQGFELRPTFRSLCEELRYMILLRGTLGLELVLDKTRLPIGVTNVDMATIEWFEKAPGKFKPQQKTPSDNRIINLDIPTFFVSFFRRDPTEIYTKSFFVAAINTIAARQQVINDLYRIMQITGYPRMELTVLEEVLMKAAPSAIKQDPSALSAWVKLRVTEAANTFSSLRPDQVYSHTDSIKAGMINDNSSAMTLDISQVMNTLNAQNQAALKTVATVIGRGESGVNTASVEARVFSLSADELNNPIEDAMGQLLTLALRLQGYKGSVEISFRPVELRPTLELEPQMTMRQARQLEALSIGVITDEEYHLELYGRLPPAGYKPLSGTGFMSKKVDTAQVSPNSDPLGRSLSPEGSQQATSNTVKK